MSWARLDDQFADHPKVRALGVFSLALQSMAICYCARYLTDGFLSWSAADQLVASVMAPFSLPDGRIVTPCVTSGMSGEDAAEWDWKARMVEAGLWERTRKGFLVHDYLLYNPTRESVLKERKNIADRVARFRAGRNAVTNTVGNGVSTPDVRLPRPRPPKKLKASAAQGVRSEHDSTPTTPEHLRPAKPQDWPEPEAGTHVQPIKEIMKHVQPPAPKAD